MPPAAPTRRPIARNSRRVSARRSMTQPIPPHVRIPARRVPVAAHPVPKPDQSERPGGGMGRAILSAGVGAGPPEAPGELVKVFTSSTIQSGAKARQPFPRPREARPRGGGYALHVGTGREVDVRLAGVTKRFGDVVAVDDIALDILQGEFFSLLGPSGCGKTTTLRMIGGFEQPDEGAIELAGANVAGLPPHRRDVNTVFQSYALFPHLNVFDNVAYGLRRRRIAKDHIPGQVRRILELVDLPRFEARRITQLSGGQQQRVALARALVNQPRVLLLDQEEAMTMSDRIAVMREGRIEQVGPPEEVYERPATEFVASFLGASNLLDGTVGPPDGDFRTIELVSGEKVRVPAAAIEGTERSIKLGVRPEKIRIGTAGSASPADGDNAIEGTVRDATFVGVSNVYAVATRDGHEVTVYAQNLGTSTDRPPAPGETVTLTWHPEHTFVVSGREGGADGE